MNFGYHLFNDLGFLYTKMKEIGFKALGNTLPRTSSPGQKYWNGSPTLHKATLTLAFHEIVVFTHNKQKAILDPFIALLTTPARLKVSNILSWLVY